MLRLRGTRSEAGFTLVEIMIVVMIMSLIFGIAIPTWIGARERSQVKVCVSQLRKVEYAKDSWAMEKMQGANSVPGWDDITPYLRRRPACPTGGDYTIGMVSVEPTCSIGGEHVIY